MKDYRLEIKVKNGLMWKAMQTFGHSTVAELSRATGINQQILGRMINLKQPAISRRTGRPTETVEILCDYFGMSVDELFPPEVILDSIPNNVLERWADAEDFQQLGYGPASPKLIEEAIDEVQLKDLVQKKLDGLTKRERRVLTRRFGLDGRGAATYEVIGKELDVSLERVRQIEAKAMRMLRNPANNKELKEHLYA